MTAIMKRQRKQSHKIQSPEPLSREARRVLLSVFKAAELERGGVDMTAYRAKHVKHWDMLGMLEQDGYLRKDTSTNKYFVSLIGLTQLSAKRAKKLLADSERVFAALKKSYKTDPHAKVPLSDLAAKMGLAIDEVKECLDYMLEILISRGHNLGGDKVDIADMYVIPYENVVSPKYRRFRDLIAERLHMVAENRKARSQYQAADRFPGEMVNKDELRRKKVVDQPIRNKPDWYRSLKPGIKSLMDEVSLAIDANARTLAAMGLRAAVDMACSDVLGDIGGFDKKLEALEKSGRITAAQKRTLANALELGHAAAHRGHIPTLKGIAVLHDIIEHLLKQMYLHEPASERLRQGVPTRRRQSPV